mgnify:CR=1 FL=1|tara:strand:+ start:5906 stop:6610 length:705 start_codon:yes stop_codon:yes gene_type:complete
MNIGGDLESTYDGGVDEVNVMGDFLDFYWCSLHPRLPEAMSIKETMRDEIAQGIEKLEEIRHTFPNAVINFIEGNHEYRLMRWLTKKAPELFDIIKLPELLHFKELGIKFHPFGKNQLVSCLGTDYMLRHQPFNMGKHCAAGTAHAKHISLGFGHTHRHQSYSSKDALGREICCYSMGWLGDESAPVFSYMDHDNWVQSFQVVTALSKKDWFIDTIKIKKKRAVYNGIIYESDL